MGSASSAWYHLQKTIDDTCHSSLQRDDAASRLRESFQKMESNINQGRALKDEYEKLSLAGPVNISMLRMPSIFVVGPSTGAPVLFLYDSIELFNERFKYSSEPELGPDAIRRVHEALGKSSIEDKVAALEEIAEYVRQTRSSWGRSRKFQVYCGALEALMVFPQDKWQIVDLRLWCCCSSRWCEILTSWQSIWALDS
jgi:hypothetical protein